MSEIITGSIERITFHNENNGFSVLKIKTKKQRELVTVVGNAINVNAGEYIEGSGNWFNDKNHGLQFKANNIKTIEPNTLEGIEKYLGSGLIKGIGPGFAKRLINNFGIEVLEIIDKNPERLKQVEGLGNKRATQIANAWSEQKKIRKIIIFLHKHGVGTARAVRIYKIYGDNSIEKITQNPYRLAADIRGIGFKTSDQLALKLGIPKDSILRAQAGIVHTLQEHSSEGHCAIFLEELITKAANLLEAPPKLIEEAINLEIKNNNIISEEFDEKTIIQLKTLHKAEQDIAKRLKLLKNGITSWSTIDIKTAIPWVEKKTKLQLSASQKDAIIDILKNKVAIITGGPGVGKTTVMNSILKLIQTKTDNILLCAPTGRAAKRLEESTKIPAKTIHRLLAFDPTTRKFKFNENNFLHTDLVVIDESSMIDVNLFNNLLKAIPAYAGIIIIGDIDQLPSVGPGSVLANIIQSEIIVTAKLTEIFRQAKNSAIITTAHQINKGIIPKLEYSKTDKSDFYFIKANEAIDIQRHLLNVVVNRIPEKFNFNPITDIQVLTPMNKGNLGALSLNIELKKCLNKCNNPDNEITKYGITFSKNDKIIQMVNNYDKDVFNGDIGFIKDIDKDEEQLVICFDEKEVIYEFDELDEIVLAYATTIHKSQGSEYPAVVIPIAMQHFTLLERNLIYTAITRGKKLVVVIGQSKAIAMAVKNSGKKQRLTRLTEKLFN